MASRTKRVDQTAGFRSALLAERVRITGGGQKELDSLVRPGSVALEDQAPLMHDQFVALRQHRMDLRKLKMIDAALARIDRGEFGLCSECEEPIPVKRLQVVPWAAYCVPCQDRADARGDGDTDGGLAMIA